MTLSVTVSACSLGSLLLLACGDRKPPGATPPPPGEASVTSVPPERGPLAPENEECNLPLMSPTCPVSVCGYNTSVLTGFAFGVLNLDGCRNMQSVRLVVGSLRVPGDACKDATHLDIVDGGLVGVKPGSQDVSTCQGAALRGATFWLEAPLVTLFSGGTIPREQLGSVARIEMRIAEVGSVTAPPDGTTLPTFVFEKTGTILALHDRSSTNPGDWTALSSELSTPDTELCEPAGQWVTDWSADAQATTGTQHALIVAGEGYFASGRHNDLITEARKPKRWFNVACAGSALAKSRLLGNDPMSPTSTRARRVATLKMILASYCKDAVFTRPGVPVFIDTPGGTNRAAVSGPDANRIGEVEARWTEEGASCLSHSRLWHGDTDGMAVINRVIYQWCGHFVSELKAKCGRRLPDCARVPVKPEEHWVTYTVDHIHAEPAGRTIHRPTIHTIQPLDPIEPL